MPRCLIRTCPISSSAKAHEYKVHLHVFPKQLERIKTWLMCTGHPFKDLDAFANRIFTSKANDSFRICSAHFTKDSYIMKGNVKLLHPEAIPCIFQLIPGQPMINEEIRLRVVKRPNPPPPPPSSSVASSSSQPKYVVPLKKAAVKVDSDTQTDLQYTMCRIAAQKEQPLSAGLRMVHFEQGYHYLITTPLKLREGTMNSGANGTFLEIPVCGDKIATKCKTEMVHTRVALLSSGSHLTSNEGIEVDGHNSMSRLHEEHGPYNVKEEESDVDIATFNEELGLHIVKVEESCIDIASFNEEHDPCRGKVEEPCIDIASFNEELSCNVKVEESCIDIASFNQGHGSTRVKVEKSCIDEDLCNK